MSSYIERKLTGAPLPCFQEDTTARGFRCLVLLDRSTSMQGDKTKQAEKACRLLSRALKYPFVTFEVWGFQAREGEITITRFAPGLESFTSDKSIVVGQTPLHIAIRIAARHLGETDDLKQLVAITDGVPIFTNTKDYITIDPRLIDATRREVMAARSKGIIVTGLVIEKQAPPSQLFKMFGANRNWRYLEKQNLGSGIIKTVTGSFVNYLKRA